MPEDLNSLLVVLTKWWFMVFCSGNTLQTVYSNSSCMEFFGHGYPRTVHLATAQLQSLVGSIPSRTVRLKHPLLGGRFQDIRLHRTLE